MVSEQHLSGRLPLRIRGFPQEVPVSEPAPTTADLILEAWEFTAAEHPEWGVVRLGAVATCVNFPSSDLGYPKKDMATSGYESQLGLPTAPQVAVLLGWTDNLHMKRFMETFGLTPILAKIAIEETVDGAAWTFNLAVKGEELYSGIFPKAQRNPNAFGARQSSPCQPVKQQGTFIEWPKDSDTFGVVDFQNAVRLGSTEVNANRYACLGGQWAWTSATTYLLGPVRPSALADRSRMTKAQRIEWCSIVTAPSGDEGRSIDPSATSFGHALAC